MVWHEGTANGTLLQPITTLGTNWFRQTSFRVFCLKKNATQRKLSPLTLGGKQSSLRRNCEWDNYMQKLRPGWRPLVGHTINQCSFNTYRSTSVIWIAKKVLFSHYIGCQIFQCLWKTNFLQNDASNLFDPFCLRVKGVVGRLRPCLVCANNEDLKRGGKVISSRRERFDFVGKRKEKFSI